MVDRRSSPIVTILIRVVKKTILATARLARHLQTMEQTLSFTPLMAQSERIRQDLGLGPEAINGGDLRLVSASARSWPDFARLDAEAVIIGDDGLIRVAVWSASSICTTLMHSRRATLLAGHDDAVEVRCLVIATAGLDTTRPLSGFLLKPVERIDARVACRPAKASQKNRTQHGHDIRLVLLDAFPVHPNGEEEPPG